MDHKISHKVQFFLLRSENWINKLSIDVQFVRIGQYLVQLFENLEFKKSKY